MQGPLAVEITFAGVESIREGKIVVKYEIMIVQEIDHGRRGGDGQITRRLAAAAVEELIAGI